MAVELRPDLILLDIGLPSLNGIEVARQMRSLVPESKIIFLTQESSAEVLQEALNLGARGYVIKITAASELLTAVETVLSGKTWTVLHTNQIRVESRTSRALQRNGQACTSRRVESKSVLDGQGTKAFSSSAPCLLIGSKVRLTRGSFQKCE